MPSLQCGGGLSCHSRPQLPLEPGPSSPSRCHQRHHPSGIVKRPDGISVVPWRRGKLLVWDATCPDTFAPSYSALATIEAEAVAAKAEAGKCQIYSHLDPNHLFEPVAIETSGAFGPSTRVFLEELRGRLKRVMGEANAIGPTFTNASLWRCKEEMRHPSWAPSAPHLTLQISFFPSF